MRASLRLFVFLAVLVVPLSAGCGWLDDSDGNARVVVDAPIEKVEIAILKSNPPQYDVLITSGLPSGCAQYDATTLLGQSGDTIRIRVTNTMPKGDAECTAIYGYYESTVHLGSAFTMGVTYTVDVNGTTKTFTAQ